MNDDRKVSNLHYARTTNTPANDRASGWALTAVASICLLIDGFLVVALLYYLYLRGKYMHDLSVTLVPMAMILATLVNFILSGFGLIMSCEKSEGSPELEQRVRQRCWPQRVFVINLVTFAILVILVFLAWLVRS